MNYQEIIDIIAKGNKRQINAVISDRKQMPEARMRILSKLIKESHPDINIEMHEMSQAREWNISRNREFLGSQFYWKDGVYDANGNHSLYDEYGFPLAK